MRCMSGKRNFPVIFRIFWRMISSAFRTIPDPLSARTASSRCPRGQRFWDGEGREGVWSEPAVLEKGMMDKSLFKAEWINPELVCDPEAHKPASCLKKQFHAQKGKQARLYITCHGLYEAYINGKRVREFVLAPGSYNYDRKVAYQTYDVTDLIQDGENLAEVILGDGRYRSVSGVDGVQCTILRWGILRADGVVRTGSLYMNLPFRQMPVRSLFCQTEEENALQPGDIVSDKEVWFFIRF